MIMKIKKLQDYIETKLTKDEIDEIERQAQLEVKLFKSIQQFITLTMDEYMAKHDVGFNELVRRLDSSPAHVAKIRRGEANLTLSSLVHVLATLETKPEDIFRRLK